MSGAPLIDPPRREATLSDGRLLTWQEYGAVEGRPVLYFHGGGGTSLEGGIFHREALAHGIRLLATNRPGAGGSSLRPGRPVARYADDVDELLDRLDVGDVACFGESNGGLVAMAMAAALPGRVRGAAPINPTLPWFDPVARSVSPAAAAIGYRLMRVAPRLVARVDAKTAAARDAGRSGRRRARGDENPLLGPPPGVEPDVGDFHERVMATRAGRPALLAELAWARGPWGFDHYAIGAPLDFFCGVHDVQAPFALVLADRNPDARFHSFSFGHNGFSHPDARRRIVEVVAGHLDRAKEQPE